MMKQNESPPLRKTTSFLIIWKVSDHLLLVFIISSCTNLEQIHFLSRFFSRFYDPNPTICKPESRSKYDGKALD